MAPKLAPLLFICFNLPCMAIVVLRHEDRPLMPEEQQILRRMINSMDHDTTVKVFASPHYDVVVLYRFCTLCSLIIIC